MMAKLSNPVNNRWDKMFTVSPSNDEKIVINNITVAPRAIDIGVPVSSRASRIATIIRMVMKSFYLP
tara:strand:+ start:1957 stop:2157 length:201 start_codon:yes stop_codon:yes gene_type:complete